jgi:hypothetical protein
MESIRRDDISLHSLVFVGCGIITNNESFFEQFTFADLCYGFFFRRFVRFSDNIETHS